MAFTCILECCDGTFYVGCTVDLERRLTQHSSGAGATYTARRRPVRLVWWAEMDRIRDAYLLEKQLQGWSHAKNQAFLEGRFDALPGLARGRTGRR